MNPMKALSVLALATALFGCGDQTAPRDGVNVSRAIFPNLIPWIKQVKACEAAKDAFAQYLESVTPPPTQEQVNELYALMASVIAACSSSDPARRCQEQKDDSGKHPGQAEVDRLCGGVAPTPIQPPAWPYYVGGNGSPGCERYKLILALQLEWIGRNCSAVKPAPPSDTTGT